MAALLETFEPEFEIKIASTEQDILSSQRLRYKVFVEELGGNGELVDHKNKLERDKFDPYFDHLILTDKANPSIGVVGVYRVLRDQKMQDIGRFYSEGEYDLTMLHKSGLRLLELGRSCIHPRYRGGTAMYHLWQGLSKYITEYKIDILFGVASFHGTNLLEAAQPLSYLYHNYTVRDELCPRSLVHENMNILNSDQIDRKIAVKNIPPLIKSYLRLGGLIGDGAFIDKDFNTIDVCLVMELSTMSNKHKEIYTKVR
ncbi:MAG: GNAT family N-acetyltransferase [Rhodobacteraceae bacterium]|jgi:putative hemolysin|nr:GNAT family N-acetyltransferase [Paracoccaceae bacterium]|tara:strand:+ start:1501 stop:2271 length:771 start_codon:yes stop_codon:yes gene_type:complete